MHVFGIIVFLFSSGLLAETGTLYQSKGGEEAKASSLAEASVVKKVLEPSVVEDKAKGGESTVPDDFPPRRKTRALGMGAGLLSGIGFAFRTYDSEYNAHHLAGLLFGSRSSVFLNVGYEYISVLAVSGRSSFYTLYGLSTFVDFNERNYCFSSSKSNCKADWYADVAVSIGAGLGMEYGDPQGLVGALELPLTLRVNRNFGNNTFDFGIYPIPSLVLLFKF